ncbi:MAG: hypothetical protein M1296_00145 [Chloroflexi bacterium]|nr:hypothetical protein [Chloroflexota bacterium]
MTAEQARHVHVIPAFHYDVAYLQTFQGYLPRSLENLLTMVELLRGDPSYTFVVEQVILLEVLLQQRPELLPDLRRFAEEGRLEIACGMYVMPDVNMPAGESLLRQAIRGQRWLERRLGVRARTCWIADCWGHPPSLPGLLRHGGYENYVFWRGKTDWLTTSEFRWRGIDGSVLTCHWTPFGYGAVYFPVEFPEEPAEQRAILEPLRRRVAELETYSQSSHLCLPASGDFLAPRRTTSAVIAALGSGVDEYRCSTFAQFFAGLAARIAELPLVEGDFNPVFQGTYTSRVALKQFNRRLESAVLSAERAAALLWLDGGEYPSAQLDEVWRIILTNQAHDIISGTIIDEAYDEAIELYRRADTLVTRVLMDSVDRAQARRVAGSGGMGVFVFNPLPVARREVLRLNTAAINWSGYRVTTATGEVLPIQREERMLLIEAELPPLGYTVFRLQDAVPEEAAGVMDVRVETATGDCLVETDFFSVRVRGGLIASLVDRESGVEMVDLSRPFWNDLVLQVDNGDLWLLNESPLNGDVRTTTPVYDPYPVQPGPDDAVFRGPVAAHDQRTKSEITERGPLRVRLRARGELRYWQLRVEFVQEVTLYRRARRIDFTTELIPHGKHFRVRAAFPLALRDGRRMHGIPMGTVERGEGEFPTQGWGAYEAANGAFQLVSRGLPGINITDRTVLLSLFRSAAMEYKGPSEGAFEDGVRHSASYRVIVAARAQELNAPLEAEHFNFPPIVLAAADIPARVEPRVRLTPATVILDAFYRDGDTLTVRLHEAAGQSTMAQFWCAGLISCERTDALTMAGAALSVADHTVELPLGPFAIVTLRLAVAR